MKNCHLKPRRGGFTLVELLIVIIIIGILAGMMMISAGAATDKATATKIISDVRTIKGAALLYKMDYNTWPKWLSRDGKAFVNMDAGHAAILPGNYIDNAPSGSGYWIGTMALANGMAFAVAGVTDLGEGAKKALENSAKGSNIYGIAALGPSMNPGEPDTWQNYKATDNGLFMVITK